MIQEIITRVKLTAAEGMTLTDGEAYGKTVYLGSGDTPDRWHEITDVEAEKRQQEAETVGE